jgi:hypothetical protein
MLAGLRTSSAYTSIESAQTSDAKDIRASPSVVELHNLIIQAGDICTAYRYCRACRNLNHRYFAAVRLQCTLPSLRQSTHETMNGFTAPHCGRFYTLVHPCQP